VAGEGLNLRLHPGRHDLDDWPSGSGIASGGRRMWHSVPLASLQDGRNPSFISVALNRNGDLGWCAGRRRLRANEWQSGGVRFELQGARTTPQVIGSHLRQRVFLGFIVGCRTGTWNTRPRSSANTESSSAEIKHEIAAVEERNKF